MADTNSKQHPLFCVRPFTEFYIDAEGDAHLCCPQWIDMCVGNVLETPPMDIWRGPEAQEIRDSIEDGSFSHCRNCGNRGCIQPRSFNPPSVARIETLTLSYDLTCNLRCPSCRTVAQKADERTQAIHNSVTTYDLLQHVNCIRTAGNGDPIASKYFWRLLTWLEHLSKRVVDAKVPSRLELQTNGLLLTPEVVARITKVIPISQVLVSVDASHPDTYRELRGGNWYKLMSNLNNLASEEIPLQLNFVVQTANFQEMPAFVRLAKQLNAKVVYFSGIENWCDYPDDVFGATAIHRPEHPRHHELLSLMSKTDFRGSDMNVVLARLPKL